MRRVEKINLTLLITFLFVTALSASGLVSSISSNVIRLLVSQAAFAIPMILYLFFFSGERIGDAISLKRTDAKSIIIALLLGITTRPIASFFNLLSLLFSEAGTTEYMAAITDSVPWPVAFILIGCVPSFLEELVYRGAVFGGYRKANRRTAVFVSALVFGLMHGNVNQFMYAVVMGFIFAIVVEAADSVIPTMIMHMMINGVSVLLLYLSQMSSLRPILGDVTASIAPEQVPQMILQYAPSFVCGVLLSFLLVRCLARINGRWEHLCTVFRAKKEEQSEKIFNWALIATIVLCLAEMILGELAAKGIIK